MKKSYLLQSRIFAWFFAALFMVVVCIGGLGVWRIVASVRNDADVDSGPSTKSERKVSAVANPRPPRSDYVGSATCAECHPQIANSYHGQPMAQSMAEVSSALPMEDYADQNSFAPDVHHTYSVEKTTEGVFHHERLTDENGQELYDQSVRISYALGSGHQGRAYLIDRDGLFFMSPITWYSPAHRWDLSPQYRLPVHRRFERRIIAECLDCHVGRSNPVRGVDNKLASPPFFEHAIGCERCHGPGGEHSNLHRQGLVNLDHDPIVNPSKLDPAAREDVCAQCHLQGEGSYSRFGCEVGDYRPGQRLEETRIVFVSGTRNKEDGTTRAVSQVEQMQASRCFEASNGKFGCSSCHDPHSRPSNADKALYYRTKCLACHTGQACRLPESVRIEKQADDSCLACHMPRLGANDVPHTTQTDHRILRTPSSTGSNNQPSLPEFYDHAERRLPSLAVDYARGLWLAERAEKTTDRQMANRAYVLLSMVEAEIPDDPRILAAMGISLSVLGRFDEALVHWKKSLEIDRHQEKTLELVAILLQNSGRLDEARPYLAQVLELNPWKSSLWRQYSRLLGQQKEWKEAIVAAKKSLELDPSAPQSYLFLADAFLQIDDKEQSQKYRALFERIRRVRK